jgi:hypothetical protein
MISKNVFLPQTKKNHKERFTSRMTQHSQPGKPQREETRVSKGHEWNSGQQSVECNGMGCKEANGCGVWWWWMQTD